MELVGQHILIISNESWHENWYSKHHYARELAKSNTVYFLNPPPNWRLNHLYNRNIRLTTVEPSLKVLDYHNVLPLSIRNKLFCSLNNSILIPSLNRFLKKNIFNNFLFWTFDPFRFHNPKKFNVAFSIYQSMDFYSVKNEEELCRNVDLIIAVSSEIEDRLNQFKDKLVLIPHGIPSEILVDKNLLMSPRKKEIFVAASINNRIDYELLFKIANSFQDYSLIIAGTLFQETFSESDKYIFSELNHLPNVRFIGHLPFSETVRGMRSAMVCINVYKGNYIGNMSSSLKILQYLASGTPVVSTFLSEFAKPERVGLICNEKTHDGFMESLRNYLENRMDIEKMNLRIAFASQFTYTNLLERIEQSLNKTLAQARQKVSKMIK